MPRRCNRGMRVAAAGCRAEPAGGGGRGRRARAAAAARLSELLEAEAVVLPNRHVLVCRQCGGGLRGVAAPGHARVGLCVCRGRGGGPSRPHGGAGGSAAGGGQLQRRAGAMEARALAPATAYVVVYIRAANYARVLQLQPSRCLIWGRAGGRAGVRQRSGSRHTLYRPTSQRTSCVVQTQIMMFSAHRLRCCSCWVPHALPLLLLPYLSCCLSFPLLPKILDARDGCAKL